MKRYLVFGVELEFLLEREAGGAEVLPGTIPSVIASCLSEVEARGLGEVGICKSVFTLVEATVFHVDASLDRIAGATSEINALREAFNRGDMPITESSDIYAICDLIKSWFRLLPEPVFPSRAYFAIIEAISTSVPFVHVPGLIPRVHHRGGKSPCTVVEHSKCCSRVATCQL